MAQPANGRAATAVDDGAVSVKTFCKRYDKLADTVILVNTFFAGFVFANTAVFADDKHEDARLPLLWSLFMWLIGLLLGLCCKFTLHVVSFNNDDDASAKMRGYCAIFVHLWCIFLVAFSGVFVLIGIHLMLIHVVCPFLSDHDCHIIMRRFLITVDVLLLAFIVTIVPLASCGRCRWKDVAPLSIGREGGAGAAHTQPPGAVERGGSARPTIDPIPFSNIGLEAAAGQAGGREAAGSGDPPRLVSSSNLQVDVPPVTAAAGQQQQPPAV